MAFQNSIPAKARMAGKRRYGAAKRKFYNAKPRVALNMLSSKVKVLERKVNRKRVFLQTASTVDKFKDIVSPCTQLRLCRFVDHVGILGTDDEDLQDDKVLFRKISTHLNISLENVDNEEGTTNFSVFLVSLKDNAGSMLDTATGFLNMTADRDYYQYSGWTFLNKDRFKIHHYKHLQLTNYGAALTTSGAQNQFGTNWNVDWKTPINQVVKANSPGAGATNTQWRANVYQADPSLNYYILIFNDNSAVDSEYPSVKNLSICSFEKMD